MLYFSHHRLWFKDSVAEDIKPEKKEKEEEQNISGKCRIYLILLMENAEHIPFFSILNLYHQTEEIAIKKIIVCMQRGVAKSSSYNKTKQNRKYSNSVIAKGGEEENE